MNEINKVPDKIRDKLLKLKNLAEQGYKGEAIAAKRALEEMLNKYGLTLESLFDEEVEWRWIKVGRDKYLKEILHQCHFQIIDSGRYTYKEYDSQIGFKLTASQYADLMSLFEFHSSQFKKEREKIMGSLVSAYVQKHGIWGHSDNKNEEESKNPIDFDKIKTILAIADTMENVTYHKQIE
ncbi:MAG: hypothetical protein OGM07_15265 [Bacteroides xylanisolvens]|nr:MAG: hypothetical protein OGM07_15265 [Bacteroides xylanisolvens]